MSWTLAITGKGGVGKTSLAALAVRWLGEHGRGPVLAVDADPNTCLDALLGVEAAHSVGSVREEAREIAQGGMSSGVSKQEMLDLKIQESLVEADSFDLIAMGRSEGPGCYCYANNVLRGVLARLAGQYPSVVVRDRSLRAGGNDCPTAVRAGPRDGSLRGRDGRGVEPGARRVLPGSGADGVC